MIGIFVRDKVKAVLLTCHLYNSCVYDYQCTRKTGARMTKESQHNIQTQAINKQAI